MASKRPDEDVFRRFYREHVDAVYAFFAYALEQHAAEDLTASTFERALKHWKRYDPALAGERTWLLSIARNLLVDHYRRQQHRRAASIDAEGANFDLPALDDPLGRRLDQAELRSWLAHLGDRERQVLALRYGADLQATEIADLLGLSAANVHQIVSRSLRRLRGIAEASRVSDSA